jgi:hypothetical protein
MQMITGINNIDGDKDDVQSLVHALMYQDKLDIVGIISTTSRWQPGKNDDSFIHHVIDKYATAYDALKGHGEAGDFKTAAQLHAMVDQGTKSLAPSSGITGRTAGSDAIIAAARDAKADGVKLNVVTWGGQGDVARALHDAPDIAGTIRLHSISDQDPNARAWIAKTHKGKNGFEWIDDITTHRGVYASEASKTPISISWAEANAKGHGAFGDFFYQNNLDIRGTSGTVNGMKMGDSTTILRLIDQYSDANPAQESWGGEFRLASTGYWTDRTDQTLSFSGSGGARTVYEDRTAWTDDFAERFDWIDGTPAPLPPKVTDPAPAGDDTITITLGGSNYLGDPMAAFIFDGKEIGRVTITADYEKGEAQTFTFKGAYDSDGLQTHRITVKLLNDKWDGNKLATTDSGHDRNLFVESVVVNGVTKEPNKLITSGSAGWDLQV